jgi:hypothetical protein
MTPMADRVCERCGAAATVGVVAAGPNRGGVRPTPTHHHYCSDCARVVGIRVRRSRDPEGIAREPELPSWSDLEQYLAEYADVIDHAPELRDHVTSLGRRLLQFSRQLSGPMPSSVAAAFERIGIDSV